MAKRTMVYPYSWIFFGNNKEQTSNKWNELDETPANYANGKKTISKGHTLYSFTYKTFLTWQNYKKRTYSCLLGIRHGVVVGIGRTLSIVTKGYRRDTCHDRTPFYFKKSHVFGS